MALNRHNAAKTNASVFIEKFRLDEQMDLDCYLQCMYVDDGLIAASN